MRVKHATANDIRYKQLSFGTVRSVHNLKLNRRKRGSRGGQTKNTQQKIKNQQELYGKT